MIAILYNTTVPISIFGINHFIYKSGISIYVNPSITEKLKLVIEYGEVNNSKNQYFKIKIPEMKIGNEMRGCLKNDDYNIPIFEEPLHIDIAGKTLLEYSNKRETYPCVVLSENSIEFGFDVFKEIGQILSRIQKNPNIKIPVVDILYNILFDSILLGHKELKIPLIQKTYWPDGKEFAVCLTHDVDRINKRYQYFTHPIRLLSKGKILLFIKDIYNSIKGLSSHYEPYWGFDKVIEIEKSYGVRSTFFFLNEPSEYHLLKLNELIKWFNKYDICDIRILNIIDELHKNGWEIALHGSFDSYKNFDKLKTEKHILEDILNHRIYGIRQHYLNIDENKTWNFHEILELEYDSSIGVKNDIGFLLGTCFPFTPFDLNKKRRFNLIEIPLSIMDTVYYLNDNDIWSELKQVFDNVLKFNGVLTVLWHQSSFNKYEVPDWIGLYEKLLTMSKEENAWIATAHRIAHWWKIRNNNDLKCEYAKNILIISYTPTSRTHFIKIYNFNMKIDIISNNVELISKNAESFIIKTIKTIDTNNEIKITFY